MTISERVTEVLKYLNHTQAELARSMGTKPQYINALLKKDKGIGLEFVNKFIDIYPNLNIRWFLKGEGDMFILKLNKEIPHCSSCLDKERLIKQLQDQLKDKERLIQVLENKTDQKEAC